MHRRFFRYLSALFVAAVTLGLASEAAAQIRVPGAHPRYRVELEPHLLIQHSAKWVADDAGFGPGLRASIPLIADGPIPSINNSLAIGFGLDASFHDECQGRAASACDVRLLWFPVVAQWNFYFTPRLSAFGEAGLAFVHGNADSVGACISAGCGSENPSPFQPVFFGGGRFMLTESIGVVMRLGSPYVSAGATFLL